MILRALVASVLLLTSTAAKSECQGYRQLSTKELLGAPISAVWGPDESAFVADLTEPAVHHINRAGRLVWSLRSKGTGPGDVLRPYRIAWSGRLLFVYDFAARDISTFDESGKFQRRFRLDLPLQTVDNILAFGDSSLVVLGLTRISKYESYAIHVFDASGRHRRSFAAAPLATDRARLAISGAGTLSATPTGNILYTRKGPYQILEYKLDGELVRERNTPMRIGTVADSLVTIEVNESGTERISSRAKEVTFPLLSISLGESGLLTSVSKKGASLWWLEGKGSRPLSIEFKNAFAPSAWNPNSCELLGIGTIDEEPVLVAVSLRELSRSLKIQPITRC